VSLSARGNSAVRDFAATVRARIEALGRAHDYVRPDEWQGRGAASPKSLRLLLEALLQPYLGGSGERIRIDCEDREIGPSAATAFALAMHEFATNAVKYGALSEPAGFVELSGRETEQGFELHWAERNGPPVPGKPETEGFGAVLARRSITLDLEGDLQTDWAPQGLSIHVTIPAERLAR
jgi:two-component sensor histidine kinase